ncbi:DUF1648 domain-containing protein [Streptococcus entericus]|uniref:DUF1648 domain-containing protein n=1 Tax=Streptococcus entericus TaxID=155680 RepID=UPI0003735F2A|nr:DUF1648 domain-containing protein [Streptococcus entericus]
MRTMMKKIDWTFVAIGLGLCLLPLVLGQVFWADLPDKFATHVSLDGQVNGVTDKSWMLVGQPVLLASIYLALSLILDGLGIGAWPVMRAFKLGSALLITILQTALLFFNLGWDIDMRKVAILIVAIGWLLVGNYGTKEGGHQQKKLEQTAVSLVLRKQTSYVFVGAGLVLLLSLLFPIQLSLVLLFLLTFGGICWSIYASYLSHRP